jgi:hypothetical protein
VSRFVATEADLPVAGRGLGPGWADLVRALNVRLFHLEPPARASCGADATVLVYDPQRRASTRQLCEAVERTMLSTCESCGEPGAVRVAAHTIQILCAACGVPSERTSRT